MYTFLSVLVFISALHRGPAKHRLHLISCSIWTSPRIVSPLPFSQSSALCLWATFPLHFLLSTLLSMLYSPCSWSLTHDSQLSPRQLWSPYPYPGQQKNDEFHFFLFHHLPPFINSLILTKDNNSPPFSSLIFSTLSSLSLSLLLLFLTNSCNYFILIYLSYVCIPFRVWFSKWSLLKTCVITLVSLDISSFLPKQNHL